MKLRQWVAGLFVTTVLLLLVACNSSNDTTPTTAVTTAAPITTVATTTMPTTIPTTMPTTTAETTQVTTTTAETTTATVTTTTSVQTTAPVEPEIFEFTPLTGETVDTGSIRAIRPDGWNYVPLRDYFSEDENAISPNNLFLMKGSDDNLDSYPFISITFYGEDNKFFMTLEEEKKYYGETPDDVKDIAFILGDDTWVGFSFKIGSDGEELVLRNQSTSVYTVAVRTKDTLGSVSLTDDDVLTILSTIEH